VFVYSVCGLIVPQEDLPFNDLGMCPDVVSDIVITVCCCCCYSGAYIISQVHNLIFRYVMYLH